jgi:hypothetical protein
MFYDKNGKCIREGSKVEFFGKTYFIKRINGDRLGDEGCSTITLDSKPHVDTVPDETNISLVEY